MFTYRHIKDQRDLKIETSKDNNEIMSLDFSDCIFQGQDLSGISFKNCNFDRVEFKDCILENAMFDSCSLDSTKFLNVKAGSIVLDSCDLHDMSITESDFSYSFINNSCLDYACFLLCDFIGSSFKDNEMNHITINRSDFSSADFIDCQLSGSFSSKTYIRDSKFEGVLFTDSEINLAFISNSDFNKSYFKRVSIDYSQIIKCQLNINYDTLSIKRSEIEGSKLTSIDTSSQNVLDLMYSTIINSKLLISDTDVIIKGSILENVQIPNKHNLDINISMKIRKKIKYLSDII